MPTAMATTSSAVTANPTRTADATIPRTDSTRIATAAMDTTTMVSTTRSITMVPRIVVRLIPVRSPKSWLRTTSPRRAGSTLLARYPTSRDACVSR